jgi:hypothetical protein
MIQHRQTAAPAMGLKMFHHFVKMIARQKDTGLGWKLEDFEFRAAFTIVQHLQFFFLI